MNGRDFMAPSDRFSPPSRSKGSSNIGRAQVLLAHHGSGQATALQSMTNRRCEALGAAYVEPSSRWYQRVLDCEGARAAAGGPAPARTRDFEQRRTCGPDGDAVLSRPQWPLMSLVRQSGSGCVLRRVLCEPLRNGRHLILKSRVIVETENARAPRRSVLEGVNRPAGDQEEGTLHSIGPPSANLNAHGPFDDVPGMVCIVGVSRSSFGIRFKPPLGNGERPSGLRAIRFEHAANAAHRVGTAAAWRKIDWLPLLLLPCRHHRLRRGRANLPPGPGMRHPIPQKPSARRSTKVHLGQNHGRRLRAAVSAEPEHPLETLALPDVRSSTPKTRRKLLSEPTIASFACNAVHTLADDGRARLRRQQGRSGELRPGPRRWIRECDSPSNRCGRGNRRG